MKKIELAIALVRNQQEKKIRWLARRNSGKPNIEFIVANRLEAEQTRETIAREVAWVWELNRQSDFLVSSMAQINLEFVAELPELRMGPGKHHIIASFYNVEVYRSKVIDQLNANSHTIWLDSDEICAAKTRTGIPIDPMFVALNQRGQVIQRWESNT